MNTNFYGARGQAIGKTARAYEEITCRMLTRTVIDDIGYYIDQGCDPDLIIKAIDITAGKGADWRYTKAIMQRCVDEGIYNVLSYDFRLRCKKGIAEIKRQHGALDEPTLILHLMVTYFKEDVLAIQEDFERYCIALENGDVSEWEERWRKYQII